MSHRALPVLLIAAALLAAGCEDIRRFSGTWAGAISADPAHQQGLGSDAVLRVEVASVTREHIEAVVDLPGPVGDLPFEPIRRAQGDALGDLRLDGEPLRSYLGYLRPPGDLPYLCVISVFAEERLDVRVIRGPDETYGVFSLRRVQAPRGTLDASSR